MRPNATSSRARKMLQATKPKPRKPVPRIIHLENITDDDIEIIGANTRKRKRLKSPNTVTVTCNFKTSSSPPKKRLRTSSKCKTIETQQPKQVYSIFKPKPKPFNPQHINHHKTSDPLLSVLQTRFGLDRFRPSQRNAIQALLDHKDVLILMPTGGGKSLCFQLPACMLNKLVIVLSPLIALMKNHVDALTRKGITAKILNSTVSASEKNKTYEDLQMYASMSENDLRNKKKYKRIEILYTTPEQLTKNQNFSNLMRTMYDNNKIGMFAIDECHCISSWGHDFRPSYRSLTGLRYQYPNVPIMALTATATTQVRRDIIQNLQLKNPQIIMSSFNRPNLYFEFKYIENVQAVKPWIKSKKSGKRGKKRSRKVNKKEITKINQKICDSIYIFIKNQRYQHKCGLIYVFSRKDTETIAYYLKSEYKLSCEAYHAGMGNKKKVQIQDNWQNNKTNIIVATCAFGMGIDQKNVRFVIHTMINKCLEQYYQEIGRAGRDNKSSHILCYYSVNMLNKHRGIALKESICKISRYKKKGKSKEEIKRMAQNDVRYKQITSNLEYVQQFAEPTQCRRVLLMKYFNENLKDRQNTKCCDFCDNPRRINRMRMQYEKKRGFKNAEKSYDDDEDTESIEQFSPQNWDSNQNNNNNNNNYNNENNRNNTNDSQYNNNTNNSQYNNNTNDSQYNEYEESGQDANNGSGILLDVSSTTNVEGLTIETRENALFKFLGAIEENIKGHNSGTMDVFTISQQKELQLLQQSNKGFLYSLDVRKELERIKKCTNDGVLWENTQNAQQNEILHEIDTNTNNMQCRDNVSLHQDINSINMNVNSETNNVHTNENEIQHHEPKHQQVNTNIDVNDCHAMNNSSAVDGVCELLSAMQIERDCMIDMIKRRDYAAGFERWKKLLNDEHTPKVNELYAKYKSDLLRMESENNTQYTQDIDKERELLISLVLGYNPKRRSQIIWNSDLECFKQTEDKYNDFIDKRMAMIENMKLMKGNKCNTDNNQQSHNETVDRNENNYGCAIKEEEDEEDEDEDDDLEILSLNKNHSNVSMLISMGFASQKVDKAWCRLKNNRDTMHINADHPSFINAMLEQIENV